MFRINLLWNTNQNLTLFHDFNSIKEHIYVNKAKSLTIDIFINVPI